MRNQNTIKKKLKELRGLRTKEELVGLVQEQNKKSLLKRKLSVIPKVNRIRFPKELRLIGLLNKDSSELQIDKFVKLIKNMI